MIHFRNNMTLRMLFIPIGLLSLRGYTAGSARLMGQLV